VLRCHAQALTPTDAAIVPLVRTAAIKICGPGVPINEIGRVINEVADQHKYGVVKTFVGHGVGTEFHSWPHIMHFRWGGPGAAPRHV
jgi:methionine aminopeptidase